MNWNLEIDIFLEITRINVFTSIQAGCLATVLWRISGLKGGSDMRWGK
jgi:hypothetical protein